MANENQVCGHFVDALTPSVGLGPMTGPALKLSPVNFLHRKVIDVAAVASSQMRFEVHHIDLGGWIAALNTQRRSRLPVGVSRWDLELVDQQPVNTLFDNRLPRRTP